MQRDYTVPVPTITREGRDICSAGVYLILHRDWFYIGGTKNVHVRWGSHRSALRRGSHGNPLLLNISRKHGIDSLDFRIHRLFTSIDEVRLCEQQLLDTHFKDPRCMNIASCATHPTQGRPLTPEHRAKIAATHWGMRHTPESRQKMSEAKRGKKQSAAWVAKRKAALQGQRFKSVVLEHPDWTALRQYPSVGHAAEDLGMNRANLSNRLNGNLPWPTKGPHKGLVGRFG